jgi:hypothetical protein
MLGLINLFTGSEYLWFLWPAMGWGIGLAFHLVGTLTGKEQAENQANERPHRHDSEANLTRQVQTAVAPQADHQTTAPQRPKSSVRPVQYPLMTKGKPAKATIWTHLDKALAYQTQIDALVQAARDANARARLQDLAQEVAEWVRAIEALTERISNFQQDDLIRQDVAAVPQAINDLQTRLERESDLAIRAQVERTLTNRKNQWAALQRLENIITQAELQLESTLSALGTIYSQLLTGQSTDHVADYSRLSADVDEEVRALQDRLEALEEVKLGQGH